MAFAKDSLLLALSSPTERLQALKIVLLGPLLLQISDLAGSDPEV
jgi:hypothetical protein